MRQLKYKVFAKLFGLFIVLIWTLTSAWGMTLEDRLRRDIENFELNYYSHVDAAFILSGVNNNDSLNVYLEWYDDLVETIRNFNFDLIDRVNSANKVFSYLHGTWLKTYDLESTTLLDIVHHKKFNCVSATILYNLICSDLGWPTEAFETPTHVYTIFSNFDEPVMVENTTPMGFNIVRNLRNYSNILAKYYPEKEVYKIGLDRLYLYEQKNGRVIDNTELLGLLAYNRAYFARKKNQFERAYHYVLLAQNFNRDSRSNTQFEINLYYLWGNELYNKKEFRKAFNLFADASYRYPEINDFFKNMKASFFHGMETETQKRNFEEMRSLLQEALDMEVLTIPDKQQLTPVFKNWAAYFIQKNQPANAEKLFAQWETVLPDDPNLKLFRTMLDEL